jgi:hypothetical protein
MGKTIYARIINTDLLRRFAEGSSHSAGKSYLPTWVAMIKDKTYFPEKERGGEEL